ncbi:MAG: hypothetical protein RLY20_1437 [Verrucomicrobiota bacterium]|jgi:hypothetical protein
MKKSIWLVLTIFTLSCLGAASASAAPAHGKAAIHQTAKKHGKKHKKKHHKHHKKGHKHNK